MAAVVQGKDGMKRGSFAPLLFLPAFRSRSAFSFPAVQPFFSIIYFRSVFTFGPTAAFLGFEPLHGDVWSLSALLKSKLSVALEGRPALLRQCPSANSLKTCSKYKFHRRMLLRIHKMYRLHFFF